MGLHLRGKRVLITGSSKGIGAAAAEAFAEEGCDLLLAARNTDQLKALAERPRSAHQIDAKIYPVALRTVEQLDRAEAQRLAMTNRTLEFLKTYDLLLTPATVVAPFPIEDRYVAECAGQKFDNYVQWLAIAYAITLVCCPALSLPCGFTASGLPVGLQMAGPPRGEAALLAGAGVLEERNTAHDADRSQTVNWLMNGATKYPADSSHKTRPDALAHTVHNVIIAEKINYLL